MKLSLSAFISAAAVLLFTGENLFVASVGSLRGRSCKFTLYQKGRDRVGAYFDEAPPVVGEQLCDDRGICSGDRALSYPRPLFAEASFDTVVAQYIGVATYINGKDAQRMDHGAIIFDDGQIIYGGFFKLSSVTSFNRGDYAIIGGTGAYRKAQGDVDIKAIDDATAAVQINMC